MEIAGSANKVCSQLFCSVLANLVPPFLMWSEFPWHSMSRLSTQTGMTYLRVQDRQKLGRATQPRIHLSVSHAKRQTLISTSRPVLDLLFLNLESLFHAFEPQQQEI